MRAWRIPCAILLVLLALCLADSAAVSRRCTRWNERSAQAIEALSHEDWQGVEQALEQLRQDWQPCRFWLRVTLSHTAVGDTDELLEQCSLLCALHQREELHVALIELRAQFVRMDADGQVNWGNIL
ncbi:MAG: DUF4363 family protein [Oscillospiraceae bacterium]|nr:DUF4363 family protein [Oscillospiraceae bacterium]